MADRGTARRTSDESTLPTPNHDATHDGMYGLVTTITVPRNRCRRRRARPKPLRGSSLHRLQRDRLYVRTYSRQPTQHNIHIRGPPCWRGTPCPCRTFAGFTVPQRGTSGFVKPPKLCGTTYELPAGDAYTAHGREHMPRRVLDLREAMCYGSTYHGGTRSQSRVYPKFKLSSSIFSRSDPRGWTCAHRHGEH